MLKALILTIFFGFNLYALEKRDPYKKQISNYTHKLNIRVIEHGEGPSIPLSHFIKATEVIFSQCQGVKLKVNVLDTLKEPKTQIHENMTIIKTPPYTLNQNFMDFFYPFSLTKDTPSIDVHLVDFISRNDRKAFKPNSRTTSGTFGKSYPNFVVDYLFRDLQYNSSLKPSQISQNSLFLSKKLVSQKLKNSSRIWIIEGKKLRATERLSSLLAHELGHVLVDSQRPRSNDHYFDHYCGKDIGFCLEDNLMVSGGYKDLKFENRQFSPLPKLTNEQCQTLSQSSLLQKL